MFDTMPFVISAISLILSIISFYLSRVNEKRKNTIDAYINLQQALYTFYEYDKDVIESFVDDATSEEYKCLSTCLAELEIFSAGIRRRVYCFKTAYSVAHGYIDISLRSRIDHMIMMKNRGKEEFYKNTQWLLHKMDNYKG